jgi:hypothetical protein
MADDAVQETMIAITAAWRFRGDASPRTGAVDRDAHRVASRASARRGIGRSSTAKPRSRGSTSRRPEPRLARGALAKLARRSATFRWRHLETAERPAARSCVREHRRQPVPPRAELERSFWRKV